MEAKDLLQLLMTRAGENAHGLARSAGVPQSTLYRFLTGSAKQPQARTLAPIASHYGIPVEAFFCAKVRDEVTAKLLIEQPVRIAPP